MPGEALLRAQAGCQVLGPLRVRPVTPPRDAGADDIGDIVSRQGCLHRAVAYLLLA